MNNAVSIAQAQVEARKRCKTDKFYLANEVLGFEFQPDTHAELFANFIRYDSEKPWTEQSEIKNVMVLWSRGHFKTTAVVVEIIQAILNNPNVRVLLMQGSVKVTKTLLHQVYEHFTGEAEGSKFKELFPEFCGTENEKGEWKFGKKVLNATSEAFTTPARTRKQLAQATVTVTSPRSITTGQHYDIGFFDDLVNADNYRSQVRLKKVRDDFVAAQPLIDPGGYRIVTGTRYAFGDLYEQILRWQNENGKWTVSVKNCWTDETANLADEFKVPRFPRFKKKSGDYGGFTREYLLEKQQDDPSAFACQYLNLPIHSSKQYFTEELLYGAVVLESETPLLSNCILMVDLAVTGDEDDDDSVIQVGRTDASGKIYVCGQRGDKWRPPELALNVIDMAVKYRPVKVVCEKSSAGMVFADLLRNMARQRNVFLPVEFIKVDNKSDAKNIRVSSLADAVKRGRFKFLAGLPKFDRLVEQAITFPKGRYGHDDYVDTSALMFMELSKTGIPLQDRTKSAIFRMIDRSQTNLMKFENEQYQTDSMTGLE